MLETEKTGPLVPTGVRASQLQEHVPSVEETAASMAPGEEKARAFQDSGGITGFEAGPGRVEEQEWVRGGGEAIGTWADRGFSVLLSPPCENTIGRYR